MSILDNRFFMPFPPNLPAMDAELEVVASTTSSRVSHIGNVWVFERTGPRRLLDSAVATPGIGRTYTNDAANDSGFVRDGTFADGSPFTWFGFANGDTSAVVQAMVSHPDGSPATEDEIALLRRIQCAADFGGLKLSCG